MTLCCALKCKGFSVNAFQSKIRELLLILCLFLGRYVERIKSTQFLLSRANRVMLCPLNKVASSSMMRLMLTLQGIDHKNIESPHGYRKRFNPQVNVILNLQSQNDQKKGGKEEDFGGKRGLRKNFCMFSLSPCQVCTTYYHST